MKLNVPSGVTNVYDDAGNAIAITSGQVDVEPHLVAGLVGQGFTIVGADSITSDGPDAGDDVTLPTE